MKKRLAWLWATVLLAASVPLLAATGTYADAQSVVVDKDRPPVVGSYNQLKKLLKSEWQERLHVYKGLAMESKAANASAPRQAPTAPPADFSGTNTQVQGVDEADIVKTDGTYLYQAVPQEVRIVKAQPADKMEVVSRITYDGTRFQPLEMYIDDKRLVVIGQANDPIQPPKAAVSKWRRPGPVDQQIVKAYLYDLADKRHPRQLRELDVEGTYLSSRKIGGNLYLVANKSIDAFRILQENVEEPAPAYRDSAQGEPYQTIPYSDIRYFPENVQPNYLMVAGVNLDQPGKPMSVTACLGSGENLYVSPDNLYVAVTQRDAAAPQVQPLQTFAPSRVPQQEESKTTVYRFAMKEGALSYSGKGTVPGTILNQFSLDEHEGRLRIATTSGSLWRTDEGTSKNNLFVLDEKLNVYGKLEGIAPGEKMYSVRFMGDRAYMVTFKQVDPLFVIDLKNPASPRILGTLKIPGYSDYLHPYDDTHIIGFGKEAESDKDMAYYQGMKIALFDVSDVSRPKELFKTTIGDRGTDSELLSNHKALLFSREKELLAFPVTVRQWTDEQKAKHDIREYGELSFQGAYVYHLDLKNGFTLSSTITHLSPDDMRLVGDTWYASDKNINRILVINDALYTVSPAFVNAEHLATHRQLGSLRLTK